jgi:hypothetical protein
MTLISVWALYRALFHCPVSNMTSINQAPAQRDFQLRFFTPDKHAAPRASAATGIITGILADTLSPVSCGALTGTDTSQKYRL